MEGTVCGVPSPGSGTPAGDTFGHSWPIRSQGAERQVKGDHDSLQQRKREAWLDRAVAEDYGVGGMRTALLLLALALGSATGAGATTLLDYITFDGIDYIRWADEPGRPLTRDDLGPEFGVIECSFGEDTRSCPYGVDASAAFLPSATRVFAVRGHRTNFRLAAIWKDRIFLYQAWRNPRAKVGADLYDIVGKVRAIDVQRGEPPLVAATKAAAITSSLDVTALVDMIAAGAVRASKVHAVAEPRYWLTLWLSDGTTLGRVYFLETSELMGGVNVPGEFGRIVERYLGPRSD